MRVRMNPSITNTGTANVGARKLVSTGAATMTNPNPVAPCTVAAVNTAVAARSSRGREIIAITRELVLESQLK